jgi:hypothetical protein
MNDDLIANTEASLREMGRDMEAAGYTLVEWDASASRRLIYNALKSPYDANGEYDEEWEYNSVDLDIRVAYCQNGEEGPGYDEQYGFSDLYATKEEQEEVLALIQQGYGIGVQTSSDQDVFVRWSKWKAHLHHFKKTVEWLENRGDEEDAESNEANAESNE